jgi:magnesium transporter
VLQALLIEGDQRSMIEWAVEKERWLAGKGMLWLDLTAPKPEEVQALADELSLHDAVVRACLHPEHRARIREFKDHFLLVLNAVGRGLSEGKHAAAKQPAGQSKQAATATQRLALGVENIGRWRTLELNVIAGKRFMITVHPEAVPAVTALLLRLAKTGEGKPSLEYLVYSVCESVTSGYYVVLDRIDKQVDDAESQLFQGTADRSVVDQLFRLKRHILYLRRVLGPQRDVMGGLMRRELPVLSADIARPYFVDLYEHTLRLFDLIDTYRDLISSSLDAYLSIVNNRMSEIMTTLTTVATIAMPLTVISGIFGMNVGGVPLTQSPLGFWAVMLLMGAISVVMFLYFRRRKWM